MKPVSLALAALVAALIGLSGCGDDSPADPGTIGSLTVRTVTSGSSLDADGYSVLLDGNLTQPIAANGNFTTTDLTVGYRAVELTGVAANCTVAGDNPRSVSVTGGRAVSTQFDVSCTAAGSIEVRTVTGGASLDTDGYAISLAGGPTQAIPANGTVSTEFAAVGNWQVELTGIAVNCTVAGENPRDVTVVTDVVSATTFDVSCAAVGSVEIATFTTGPGIDADGYSISIAGGGGEVVAANGTLTVPFIPVGNWSVELTGVAANCTVAGENPRDATVVVDLVSYMPFHVECVLPISSNQIVFLRGGDIFLMDDDGANPVRLTSTSGEYYSPALSPEGTRIAFVEDYSGYGSDIFTMYLDGSGLTNVTNGQFVDQAAQPAWSPDGGRIVFTSDREGSFAIHVMNADGSGLTRLTSGSSDHWSPSWSPDGSRILFEKDTEIFVMNADGSEQVNLTNHPDSDGKPSWSPDATRILFQTYRDGDREIYVMNADGSGQTNLTNDARQDFDPSWSPGGDRVVFGRQQDGDSDVYVMSADGSGQTNLTPGPGWDWPGSPQGWR